MSFLEVSLDVYINTQFQALVRKKGINHSENAQIYGVTSTTIRIPKYSDIYDCFFQIGQFLNTSCKVRKGYFINYSNLVKFKSYKNFSVCYIPPSKLVLIYRSSSVSSFWQIDL